MAICRFHLAITFTALLLTVTPRSADSAGLTCSGVITYIAPCASYVIRGSITQKCCNGARQLDAAASTTAARQTVCTCLKSEAASYKGLTIDAFNSVVAKCNVSLPYKVTQNTDCSKIN